MHQEIPVPFNFPCPVILETSFSLPNVHASTLASIYFPNIKGNALIDFFGHFRVEEPQL